MPKPDEQNKINEQGQGRKKLPPLPKNAVEVWKDWRTYTRIDGRLLRDNAEFKCSDSNVPIYVTLAQNGSFESEEQKKKAFENLTRTMVRLRLNGDTPAEELFPEEKRTPENFKTGMEEIWYVIGQSRLKRDAMTDYQEVRFDQNTIYSVKTTLLNDYEYLDFDAPEIGENGKKKVPKPKGNTTDKWKTWGTYIKYQPSSGSTVTLYREKRMNNLDDVLKEYRIVNKTGDFDSVGSKKRAFSYLAGIMEFFKLNGEIPAEELYPEDMRTPETFKAGVEEVWEMLRVLHYEKVSTLTDENIEAAAQKFLQEYELDGIQSKEDRAEKEKSLQDQKIKEMQEKAKKDLEQRIAEEKAKRDAEEKTKKDTEEKAEQPKEQPAAQQPAEQPKEQQQAAQQQAEQPKKQPARAGTAALPENASKIWNRWKKCTYYYDRALAKHEKTELFYKSIQYYDKLRKGGDIEEGRETAFRKLADAMELFQLNDGKPAAQLFPEDQQTPKLFRQKMEELWGVLSIIRLNVTENDQQEVHFQGTTALRAVEEYRRRQAQAMAQPKEQPKAEQPQEQKPEAKPAEQQPKAQAEQPKEPEQPKLPKVPAMPNDASKKWASFEKCLYENVHIRSDKKLSKFTNAISLRKKLAKTGKFSGLDEMDKAFQELAGVMVALDLNQGIAEKDIFPDSSKTPEVYMEKVDEIYAVVENVRFRYGLGREGFDIGIELTKKDFQMGYEKLRKEYSIPDSRNTEETKKKAAEIREELRKQQLEKERLKKEEEEKARKKEEDKRRQEEEKKRQEEEKKRQEEEKIRQEEAATGKKRLAPLPPRAGNKWHNDMRMNVYLQNARLREHAESQYFDYAIEYYRDVTKTGQFESEKQKQRAFEYLISTMGLLGLNGSKSAEEFFPEEKRTPENFKAGMEETWYVFDKIGGNASENAEVRVTPEQLEAARESLFANHIVHVSQNTAPKAENEKAKQEAKQPAAEQSKAPEQQPVAQAEQPKAPEQQDKKPQLPRVPAIPDDAMKIWDKFKSCSFEDGDIPSEPSLQYFRAALTLRKNLGKKRGFESVAQMDDSFRKLAGILTTLGMNQGVAEEDLFPDTAKTPEVYMEKVDEIFAVVQRIRSNHGMNSPYFLPEVAPDLYKREFEETFEQLQKEYAIPDFRIDVATKLRAAEIRAELHQKEAKQPEAEQPKEQKAEAKPQEQPKEQPKEQNPEQPQEQKEDLKQEEKAPAKPVVDKELELLRRRKRQRRQKIQEEYDREIERERKREEELERYRKEEEARKKQQEEAAAAKKAEIDKRKAAIAAKLEKARTEEEEDDLQRDTLPEKLKGYDTPYDAQSWKETREKYVELSNKWMVHDNDNIDVARSLKEIFDNYDKVRKDPKAFDEKMFRSLDEVGSLFLLRPRSDRRNYKVFKATVEELHTLLNAYIDIRQDEKSFYNGHLYSYFYSGVFYRTYAEHKNYRRGNLSYEQEMPDEVLEWEAEMERRRNAPKQPAPAEDAPVVDAPAQQEQPHQEEQPQQEQPHQEEQPQQEQPQQQEQPHQEDQPQQEAPQKDILDDAFESFDVASRRFLWGGSGHRTEFEAIQRAIHEYKNATDFKDRSARELYRACRVYLDQHTDNGQRQEDIGGQNQAGGRLRKQAVINIMRILDERSSKATDEHDTYRNIQADYKHYCERKHIPAIEPDYNALEGSLAKETCKAVRNAKLSVHEKAYRELQIATEAFRTKRAEAAAAQRPAAGQPQRNLQQPNNNNQNRNQPKQANQPRK